MNSWTITWGILQALAIVVVVAWILDSIRWSWFLQDLNLFKVIVGTIIVIGLFISLSLLKGDNNNG